MFILLFTFCQCLVIAGLLLAVVFSFAVFVLLRKTSFFMDSQNSLWSFYGLRKVRYMLTICAVCSPVVLAVCLPIQWRNLAIWGNGWAWCVHLLAVARLACQNVVKISIFNLSLSPLSHGHNLGENA